MFYGWNFYHVSLSGFPHIFKNHFPYFLNSKFKKYSTIPLFLFIFRISVNQFYTLHNTAQKIKYFAISFHTFSIPNAHFGQIQYFFKVLKSTGSVLVPLLFSIYISDLPATVSRKNACADDLAIIHADGDWQAVEGVLTKDMETVGEYLQTWTLKLSTTKTVSAAFHLKNKEAKRELKVNFHNETLPFFSEPKYLGVTLDRSLMYRRHLESLRKTDITRRAPEAACWLRLGCWSNNSANSSPSPGPFNRRILRACLVPQCSYPPHRTSHQRCHANCGRMPASYTSEQSSNPRRHPTCWALSQWSHTVSSAPCHGAWTSAPLITHPSIECKRTAPQIETPIRTRRTTSHQFI